MVEVNPHYISQINTGATIGQIEDDVDYPHTGLFKALMQGVSGNFVVKNNTNDFDITQSSSDPVISVAVGSYLDNGELKTTSGVATFNTAAFTFTTNKAYYLLVIDHTGTVALRVPSAENRVADHQNGDIIIAMIEIADDTAFGTRKVQFFTSSKTKNSLSVAYDNSGAYTEVGSITGTSAGLFIDGIGTVTPAADGSDKVIIQDANASNVIKSVTVAQINALAPQGDITGVTAGDGLTGGGNSGAVTLAVGVDDSTIEINSDALRIKDSGVTLAKLADITDERILGRVDNGTATVAELTKSQVLTMLNVADGATVYTDAMAIAAVEGESTLELAGAVALNNKLEFSKIGTKDFNGDVIVDYSNASENTVNHQYTLGAASNYNGKVFVIKNMHTASMNIIPAGSDTFEDNRTSTDSRWVSATQLTLKPLQSVTLQAITDSVIIPLSTPDSLAAGWMIIDDSQGGAGISNVVDDTTPQLGGNLDVNSHKITGSIVFDGDVNIEAGHTLRATTLPVVDINSDPNPLVLDTHAGRYLLCSSNVTLPSTSTQGDQYYILNDSGSSINILRNGNNINGATSDVTLTSYKGATCIAIGSNNWIVLGV